MTTLTLKRLETNEKGTFGTIQVTDRDIICHTLERPWKDNRTDVSCIPVGEYFVTPHYSPHHKDCFKVWNVTDRVDILIHIGNVLAETLGCILVGLEPGVNRVNDSRLALEKLQRMFPDEAFKLIITAHDIKS